MFFVCFDQRSIASLIILILWAISIIQLNALPFNGAGEVLLNGVPDDAAVLRQIQARVDTLPNVEEDKYTFFEKRSSLPKTTSDSKGFWHNLSFSIRPSVGVDRHAPIYQIAFNWKDLDINKNLKQLVVVVLLCGSNAKQFASRVQRSSTPISPTGKILVQKAIAVLNDPDLTQSERVWVHGLIESLQLYCLSGLDSSTASSATPSLRGELEHLRVSGDALRNWIDWLSRNPRSETSPTAKGEILESLERMKLLRWIKEIINQGAVKHDPVSIHKLYDDILEDTITRSREGTIIDKVRPRTIKHLAGPVSGWTKEISVWVLSHFMKHYKEFKSHMETFIANDKNLLSNYMDIKLRDIMDQLRSSGLKSESEWMNLARTFTLWDLGTEHGDFFERFAHLIKTPMTNAKQKALSYQALSIVSTYNGRIASRLEERYDTDPEFRRGVYQTWTHLYEELDQKKVPHLSWEHKKLGSLDQRSLIEIGTIQLEQSWGDIWGLQPLKKQLLDLSLGDIQAKEDLFYTTTQYLSQGLIEKDLSKPGPKDNLIGKSLERFHVEALAYLVSEDTSFQRKLKDLMAERIALKRRIENQMKKEVDYDFLPEDFKNKKLLPFNRWLTQSTITLPLVKVSKSFKAKSFKSLSFKNPIDRQSTM